jgi:hypothetical protein
MADYDSYRYGGVTFPLLPVAGASTLKIADPSLYRAIDFLASQITRHLGALLVSVASTAGIDMTSAVGTAVPMDPGPFLTQVQYSFPLLALWRRRSKLTNRTVVWREKQVELGVSFILKPMGGAQAEQFLPVLAAVESLLDASLESGADPNYTPDGSTAGASVWQLAGLSDVSLQEGSFGAYPDGKGFVMPAWLGKIQLVERSQPVSGMFQIFDGVDGKVDLAVDPAEGTTVFDVADFETHRAPTVSSIAPSSGTTAGGTNVTITGTGFKQVDDVKVYIGGISAGEMLSNIVVVSATQITATTRAHAPGTFDVIVVNPDGQTGRLKSGFTFT